MRGSQDTLTSPSQSQPYRTEPNAADAFFAEAPAPGQSTRTRPSARQKRLAAGILLALTIVAFAFAARPHAALGAGVAAQCNGEMNGGGTEVACTVTIVNYLTPAGALVATPPSTLTLTRCVGAAGPLNTLTCTTTVSTSTQPVTTVQQCDGSGGGGGGAVVCTVSITNHFVGSPGAITPATIYQCVGSIISGPGAPGTCAPANSPGISSIGAATVGQCNGSGNGGTNVSFICTVTSNSTRTVSVPLNVDQCNGSGNGGGARVTCTVNVTNDVIPAPNTPTPANTVVPTIVPPTATSAPPTATVAPPKATVAPPVATVVPPIATVLPPVATAVPTVAFPQLPPPPVEVAPPVVTPQPFIPTLPPPALAPPPPPTATATATVPVAERTPPVAPTPAATTPPNVTRPRQPANALGTPIAPGPPSTGDSSAVGATTTFPYPLLMLALSLVATLIPINLVATRARRRHHVR